jgi:endonuclease III
MDGIGKKCTALVAEGVYNASFRAAIDRHMLHFSIGHGWIKNAATSNEAFDILKRMFQNKHHPLMNECAEVIAQLLEQDSQGTQLLRIVTTVAAKFNHQFSMM